MIRHSAENAAYEGARAGITPGANASKVQNAANAVLAPIGVQGATVTVNPSSIAPGDAEITCTVSIPFDQNGYFIPIFMQGKTIEVECTLTREVTGLGI